MAAPRSRRTRWLPPFVVIALSAAHFLLSVDKPVHLDDAFYLEMARHIVEDPLRPMGFDYNWFGRPELAYGYNNNPPLYNYLQAAVLAGFGPSLPALHALAAGFVLLAGFAAYSLAARFTSRPLLCTALFLTCPTWLPATNLMLDTPAMALGLAATAVWIRGIDDDRARLRLVGAGLAGLAVLTKYSAAVFLPLLAIYALAARRRRAVVWLAVSLGFVALWCLHNRIVFADQPLHLLASAGRTAARSIPVWHRLVAAIVVWGSSLFFLPAILAWGTPVVRRGALTLAGAAGAGVVVYEIARTRFGAEAYAPEHLFFVINGVTLLVLMLRPLLGGPPANRDTWFLWLWFGGVTTFSALVSGHASPRYYLAGLFPATALLIRGLSLAGTPRPPVRAMVASSLLLQMGVGFVLTRSDNLFARAGRELPRQIAAHPDFSSRSVFFLGHWGFQYYAEREGMAPQSIDYPPLPGTILAINHSLSAPEFAKWLFLSTGDYASIDARRFRTITTLGVVHPWPLQTISPDFGGCLYACDYRVPLPYVRAQPGAHPVTLVEAL